MSIPFHDLKTRIADRSAISDIELACPAREKTDRGYIYHYDLVDGDLRAHVDEAVAYLTARELAEPLDGNRVLLLNTPPDTPDRIGDGIEAPSMLAIAREHGLDTHIHLGEAPFCAIGTRKSLERIERITTRLDDQDEIIADLVDALRLILDEPDYELLDTHRDAAEQAIAQVGG